MSREINFLDDVISEATLSTNGAKKMVVSLLFLLLSQAKSVKLEQRTQTSLFLRYRNNFSLFPV